MTPRRKPKPAPVDEPTDARVMPHNLEAERSVLGAILLHNESFELAAAVVAEDDFYRDAHRRIFGACRRLLERPHGIVDLVTLKNELGRHGELDEVGGPAYVSALVDGVPRSTNVAHYAAIVAEKALLRRLIMACNRVSGAAFDQADSGDEVLALADRELAQLQTRHRRGRETELHTRAKALLERIEYRSEHRGELLGVTTGFKSIDELTLGWQAGDLIILAARPSIGKTTFILNSAVQAAEAGARVGIFSLEMRAAQLEDRILSSLAGVDHTRLRSGYVNGPDFAVLAGAFERVASLRLVIDDTTRRTVRELRTACRRWRADGGLDLVIVDYLQLMPGSIDRRGATRTEELTDISRRLKELADEGGFPVIALSQLSRAAEGRSDPRPKLTDLRECGALEQDADIVAFLHRKHHREGGTTEFIVEKQRNGPTGTVHLTLTRETCLFVDGGEPIPEPTAEEKAEHTKARQVSFFKRRAHAR